MGSKAVGGKAQYRSQKKDIFDLFLWQEGKKRKTVIDRRVMERQRQQEVNVNRLKVRKKAERRMTPRSERGEVGAGVIISLSDLHLGVTSVHFAPSAFLSSNVFGMLYSKPLRQAS